MTVDDLIAKLEQLPDGALLLIEKNGIFVPLTMPLVCRAKPTGEGFDSSDDPHYGVAAFFIPPIDADGI